MFNQKVIGHYFFGDGGGGWSEGMLPQTTSVKIEAF